MRVPLHTGSIPESNTPEQLKLSQNRSIYFKTLFSPNECGFVCLKEQTELISDSSSCSGFAMHDCILILLFHFVFFL